MNLSSHPGYTLKHHGSPQRVQKLAGRYAIKGIERIAITINAFMISSLANTLEVAIPDTWNG